MVWLLCFAYMSEQGRSVGSIPISFLLPIWSPAIPMPSDLKILSRSATQMIRYQMDRYNFLNNSSNAHLIKNLLPQNLLEFNYPTLCRNQFFFHVVIEKLFDVLPFVMPDCPHIM